MLIVKSHIATSECVKAFSFDMGVWEICVTSLVLNMHVTGIETKQEWNKFLVH